MLHWAKSFAVVAVLASFAALWLYPAPLGALAVFMTAVFVTLAILSLITGALGKRRDGWSYSATQALGAVAIMAGAVVLLGSVIGDRLSGIEFAQISRFELHPPDNR